VTSLLAIRSLCNCFARRVLARALLRRSEDLFEASAAAARRHSADENARLSVVALYINCAILLSEAAAGSVEQEKVLLLTSAQELLISEPPNGKVVYRCAVVIGTLAYGDASASELARELDVVDAVARAAKQTDEIKADQQVQAVAQEIAQLLKAQ